MRGYCWCVATRTLVSSVEEAVLSCRCRLPPPRQSTAARRYSACAGCSGGGANQCVVCCVGSQPKHGPCVPATARMASGWPPRGTAVCGAERVHVAAVTPVRSGEGVWPRRHPLAPTYSHATASLPAIVKCCRPPPLTIVGTASATATSYTLKPLGAVTIPHGPTDAWRADCAAACRPRRRLGHRDAATLAPATCGLRRSRTTAAAATMTTRTPARLPPIAPPSTPESDLLPCCLVAAVGPR